MTRRLDRLRILLKDKDIDGIFISKKANITYLTGFDFLADDEREAFLFITKKKAFVITSALYREDVKKYVSDFEVLDFYESGKPFWEFIDGALQQEAKEITAMLQKEHVYRLGFESTDITYSEYTKLKKLKTEIIPVIIDSMRNIKTPDEIKKIKKACHIAEISFQKLLTIIKPGMTEKQVAYFLENLMREHLAQPSFQTIVAFGKSSSAIHHILTNTKLKQRDIVLLDFGAKIESYCSDVSRTFFVGTPTTQQAHVYMSVKESQNQAMNFLRKNVLTQAKDVDQASRQYIIEQGYPEFPHALGHSVGIQVHDGFALSPHSDFTLTNDIVFTLEPGVYLSGQFGIRIEDVVSIQNDKVHKLTKSTNDLISI